MHNIRMKTEKLTTVVGSGSRSFSVDSKLSYEDKNKIFDVIIPNKRCNNVNLSVGGAYLHVWASVL